METTQKKAASFKGIRSAGWVIVICFIIAVLIFHFVLGNPSNFMNNDPNNHPLPGNFLGTIYKGGFIVPVIQTLLLTVIALSIERYIAIGAAFGKGSLVKFVANIKAALAEGDMKKAQQICDSQRGSVANVVNATLKKYAEMENDTELSKDQKLLAIQKELEEATALELPMMEQNLPIIGTITTLGTPQFRNPTKSLRALCPKTAKNEIFLVRTDFLPRVGRYASIMPPYPHLGLQTTAPPKRLAHP